MTLVAVTSVNLSATIRALGHCMQHASFGAVKLLTDSVPYGLPENAQWEPIEPLRSSRAYSDFILQKLAAHVATSHCLLVQWDGHLINPEHWRPEFLDYDYIGASWPQFGDGHDVGNGGFSLRSRALLEACQDPQFLRSHPEDLAICRHNRALLEGCGMRFAPRHLADLFSAERVGDPSCSFGYHGVWHMPSTIGMDAFWEIYVGLDDRSTVQHDFVQLLWQMASSGRGAGRSFRMIRDRVLDAVARRRIER
ncbi:MAG: hypothetical protein EDM03_09035 [Porphyrobacter sp. IPPAS B-1204]|nr:MAG: hypothetical protein EDM03_09035 [Porphyrobacter sp. IPPAS B-1204]